MTLASEACSSSLRESSADIVDRQRTRKSAVGDTGGCFHAGGYAMRHAQLVLWSLSRAYRVGGS